MCKGNFGGVKGKEFICIMFLNGSLKFFEQDGISQSCVIPGNHTIPTNFIYVPRTDCFIILAPNWDLECYRWAILQLFGIWKSVLNAGFSEKLKLIEEKLSN